MGEQAAQRRRATARESHVLTQEFAAVAEKARQLAPGTLYRDVQGVDPRPRPMAAQEVAGLGDPMAEVFFRRGRFPMTVQELLAGLGEAGSVPEQKVYLIGEAGQIPPETAPELRRDLRFAITRAAPGRGPDLMVSTGANSDPAETFLQVISWDPTAQVFNYYMRITPAWVWAGNSWSALAPESRGRGCFDSHVNGSVVMKELKQPWANWQSMSATIQLAPDDPLHEDPLYRQVIGAEDLELTVKALIGRWTTARLAKVAAGDVVRHPDRLLRQLFAGTSVNIATTQVQSSAVRPDGDALPLPLGFWLNNDALLNDLELPVTFSGSPALPASLYLDGLARFDFRLEEPPFSRKGDTFFAFPIPEAAYEDNDVIRQMVQKGIISAKFAACALMVDFPNPVFSSARAALLKYVPATETPTARLAPRIAEAITEAAGYLPEHSPEHEFSANWALPDDTWRNVLAGRLDDYLAKVEARIGTPEAVDDYIRLAESRRRDFKAMRLHEFALTLPVTNIPAHTPRLRMNEDATVTACP